MADITIVKGKNMPKPTKKRTPNTNVATNGLYESQSLGDVIVYNDSYKSQTAQRWKNALNAARSSFNPNRSALQDLYVDIAIDAQVVAVIAKRVVGLTNKRWKFIKPDGSLDTNIQQMVCDAPWFRKMLEQQQLARFYGPACVEFIMKGGEVDRIQLVPRTHVIPEKNAIVRQTWDQYGYNYIEDPTLYPFILPLGNTDDFGLLLSMAPWVILKRGAVNDAEGFSELFGRPFRVYKYPSHDNDTRNKLKQAADAQSGAGYVIIPEGATIDWKEANATGASDFFNKVTDLYNREIAKAALGNTMTTEDGSSRSQGEVHERQQDALLLSDIKDAEDMLNWELRDRLILLGYPLQQGRFVCDMTEDLNTVSKVDAISKLASIGMKIPAKAMYEMLGLEMPAGVPEFLEAPDKSMPNPWNLPNADNPPGTKPNGPKLKAALPTATSGSPTMQAVDKLYTGSCCLPKMEGGEPLSNYDAIMERLAKAIHNGSNLLVDKELMRQTANDILNALTNGFKDGLNADATVDDNDLLAQLTNNIYRFSGAKTYQQLEDMRSLLIGEDGQVRPFTDFKQAVLTNINPKYNQAYLATEYNTTLATATEAARWQNIQADKEALPYLMYSAVLDDRTRPEHAALDGTVKPVDDPFWDTFYPPIDWNCRCTIQQVTADDATNATPTDPGAYPEVKDLFKQNAGKTGQVFTKDHPYFSGLTRKANAAINKAVRDLEDE